MKRSVLITLFSLSLFLVLVTVVSNSSASGALGGTTICLDPGHGGSDPGAVNAAYELKESDINLDVSYGLKHLFENEDAQVVMTRSGDEYLTNSDRYIYCNEQQATILISVHTNSVTDPSWDGAMALYAPNRDRYLAQAIYDVMFPFLRDTAPPGVAEFRDYGLDNFASGVLFKCDMPAAMMEPLLMSHPAEAELLVTPLFSDTATGVLNEDCLDFSCRRGQIAESIYLGTLSYFDEQSPDEMHVEAIEMSYDQKRATYFVNSEILVHGSAGQAVPLAEVAVQLTEPDGSQSTETAVTDGAGTAVFRLRTKATGTYETEVLNVVRVDWSYDPGANVEVIERLDVP